MNISRKSGFAEINGANIHYEITGSGFPLVLVHAGICDSRMWDEQVIHFAQHYQVVRYDLRGYGQTAPVAAPYASHEDLYALLNTLGIERAHLVGCSMGGRVILDFALAYPTCVASLTLVGSAPSGYQEEVEAAPPAEWDKIVAAFERGDFAPVNEYDLRTWVDGPHRTPDQVDATLRTRVGEMNLINLRNEALGCGEETPLAAPTFGRLGEIQAPTLVLIGDLDQPKMVRAADYLATHVANVRKVVMPGTAHLPNLEQPEKFNALLYSFLQSTKPITRRTLVVTPPAGYEPTIARWVWLLEDARQLTLEAIAGMSDATMNWPPPDGSNSIGTLLYHILAVELDWLYAEIMALQVYPAEGMALLTYEMRDETGRLTEVNHETLAQQLARLATGRQLLLATLRQMTLGDFYRSRSLEPYDVTPEWVLHHLLQHEAEHRGQILETRTRAERSQQ